MQKTNPVVRGEADKREIQVVKTHFHRQIYRSRKDLCARGDGGPPPGP